MADGREIVTNKYNVDIVKYKEKMTKEFKERIIHRAHQLRKEAEEQKVGVVLFRLKCRKKGRREKRRDRRDKLRKMLILSLSEEVILYLEEQVQQPNQLQQLQAEFLDGETQDQLNQQPHIQPVSHLLLQLALEPQDGETLVQPRQLPQLPQLQQPPPHQQLIPQQPMLQHRIPLQMDGEEFNHQSLSHQLKLNLKQVEDGERRIDQQTLSLNIVLSLIFLSTLSYYCQI